MNFQIWALVVLIFLSRTAQSATPIILFTYQSQHTPLPTWFEYITLCFAPLVAHVVGGVSSPIVIPSYAEPPSWSACLPHYNPISVVWRWYAIADRRLRACKWDAADMAACNAVFWDSQKARWDGSEDIMLRSRAWIIKVPGQTYVPILSASSLTTVVLTLQGVQAGFTILGNLNFEHPSYLAQGLPNVFIPLAILALLRLPAALWLSDDYQYLDVSQTENGSERNAAETAAGNPLLDLDPRTSKRATSTPTITAIVSPLSTALSNLAELTSTDQRRLHSYHSRIGMFYRIWWFLSFNGLLIAAGVDASSLIWGQPPSFRYASLTQLLLTILYFTLSMAAVLITSTYILLGRTQSTLIPCIHAVWYKVLTVFMAVMGLATVVVAALETRQLHNGQLTSLPDFQYNNNTGIYVPVKGGHGNSSV